MSDPIDRQILKADLLCGDNAEHDYCFPCRRILERIDNQPAAQPEQAVKGCRNCKYGKYNDHWKTHFCYNPNECTEWNLWEPSAQPEIIYCKKCKHWTETCGDKQWGLGDCDVFDKHLVMCNGYCAWAERREE